MDEKKKVVFINGNKSKWYEQVIFILKENDQNIPKNLVIEAEKIINEYMQKKNQEKLVQTYKNNISLPREQAIKKKKTISKRDLKFYNNVLNVSIVFTIIFICYLLYQATL